MFRNFGRGDARVLARMPRLSARSVVRLPHEQQVALAHQLRVKIGGATRALHQIFKPLIRKDNQVWCEVLCRPHVSHLPFQCATVIA